MPFLDPEKQKEYQRLWIKRRREEWFTQNGPCQKCGSFQNLELDHIVPRSVLPAVKSASIWSLSKLKREIELAKCQVLCENCHKSKTIIDLNYQRQHGSTRYGQGCRCDLCKKAHSKSRADYRKRTGKR